MTRRVSRAMLLAGGVALLALGLPAGVEPARAQNDDSAMVRLIQLLIQKGVLTPDQATSLMSQAQREAHGAKPVKTARATATSVPAPAVPDAPLVPKGTVRVTYVPQTVRDQIAAQVRDQVLGEEKSHGWAAPNQIPEWTRRITVYGDLRLRGQEDLLDKGNDPGLTDFNAINTGSPHDALGNSLAPVLNSLENRSLFRFRARLGVKADIDDWISSDIRLATGNDTSPVTENQTFGQNSNFGKYALWLDRAMVTLRVPTGADLAWGTSLSANLGRMPNPFWTTNLIYADDLNMDGAAVSLSRPVSDGVTLWATGGAFVAYNTAFNYGIDSTFTPNATGLASRDKYLFGGQVGADWKATPDILTKAAIGLFNYRNINGSESTLCTISLSSDVCSTDNSRPQFAQFGNTYFPIRNINPVTGLNNPSFVTDPQYYGLASGFNILDLHGRVDYVKYDPMHIQLEGEFVKNLAFNRALVQSKGPVNNLGSGADSPYQGGDTGWMVKTLVGTPEVVRLNQWNVVIGYKYLESDAVVDGFTDSDFHLGGTNAKGYFVGGAYGLAHNTYLNARWLSANQISGPVYRNNVVQVDLNTKF